MQQIFQIQKKYLREDLPAFRVGDILRVSQKEKIGGKDRVSTVEGIVIKLHKKQGMDATFTLRWIAAGKIGVEKNYPLHLPSIVKIEKVKENTKVRRSKLYYLRDRDSLKLKTKVQKEQGGAKKKARDKGRESGEKLSAEKGTKNSKK